MTSLRQLGSAFLFLVLFAHCSVKMALKDPTTQKGGNTSGRNNTGGSNNGGNNLTIDTDWCKLSVGQKDFGDGTSGLWAVTPDVTVTGTLRQYANDPDETKLCATVARVVSPLDGKLVYDFTVLSVPDSRTILTIGFVGEPTLATAYPLIGLDDLLLGGQLDLTGIASPVKGDTTGLDDSLFSGGTVTFQAKPSATGGSLDFKLSATEYQTLDIDGMDVTSVPGTLDVEIKF